MVKTSIKYKPLYDFLYWQEALKNKDKLTKEEIEYFEALSKVDTCIVTGGRFSAKSFEVGEWSTEAVLQHDYKILYTRFTNVSMSDSIIPEIQEKIDNNGINDYFTFSNNKYYSNCGDGLISFKGMKAGSGGQTANLKSLKGFNVMVTDEAEEIPDFETLEKVHLSIRANDKPNLTILILNPSTTDHFIHKNFFSDAGVEGGYNGIKGNVLYIHSSYLDVDPKVIPEKIVSAFEKMKLSRPNDYNEIVMGGWVSDLKGALYKKEELSRFSLDNFRKEDAEYICAFIDPADRGTDSLSMPIGYVVKDLIYITDWYFSKDNQEITIPEISFKTQEHKPDAVVIETNGLGLAYYENISKFIGSPTYPVHQGGNKHRRIISTSGYIRNYFVFRDDYEQGSHYDLAMRELFAYMKDDKENRKTTQYNDDAPDSLSSLWSSLKDLIPDKWL